MTKAQHSPYPVRERPAELAETARSERLSGLVSIRMIALFSLLRRSGSLSLRRVYDLSELQHRILTQIGQYAPLSLNGVADILLQDRGQISRTVKSMVERGLLTRERKPGGPEIEIDLAPEGEELYAQMIDRAIDRDHRLTQGIDPEQLAVFRDVLQQMVERAEIMMEEERAKYCRD